MLIRLMLLTFAGLGAGMVWLGEPGAREARPVRAESGSVEAAAETPAALESDAPVVEVAAQTPQKQERFAGPALRPSPEFGGDQPAKTRARPATAKANILYVTGSKVNFRAGPSTDNAVVGAVLGGSPVEAVKPADGPWVHIRDADGREGYMSASFLSADPPA